MSHRATLGGLSGELGGELDSILNFYKKKIEEMEISSSNRVGISLEKYREEIRDELWMTAEQAIEKGHADEVVGVSCDKTLLGTYIQVVNTFFGPLDVEFSKCPIITSPLKVSSPRGSKSVIDYINSFNNIRSRVTLEI